LLSWRLFLVHPFSCPYISRLISVINSRKVVQFIMAEARHISKSEYVALLAVKVPYFRQRLCSCVLMIFYTQPSKSQSLSSSRQMQRAGTSQTQEYNVQIFSGKRHADVQIPLVEDTTRTRRKWIHKLPLLIFFRSKWTSNRSLIQDLIASSAQNVAGFDIRRILRERDRVIY
jgi:hypothetical protein